MGDEMKVCRWCKHYENGCCKKGEDHFIVEDGEYGDGPIFGTVSLIVMDPEDFYCKDWE